MDKLIQYTGGSIILTIGAMFFAFLALIIGLISLIISINKNQAIIKAKKTEYLVFIISSIVISMMISGIVGYYLGVYVVL